MALNHVFEGPVLSKIKLGEKFYYLKDAELRELVNSFGGAVEYNVDTTFNAESANLAESKAIAKWLTDQITGLNGAMHFAGVKTKEEFEAGITGNNGDVIIVETAEYVYVDGEWILIGDEGIYATISGVKKLTEEDLKVAGVAFGEDKVITKDELLVALGLDKLGNLAWKNTATGSIETVDSATGKCAGGEYGVNGTAVEVPKTYSALDVTPAGSVTVAAQQTAAATYEKATGITLSAQASDNGNYTPAGVITLPTISITHAPTAAEVATVTNEGTAYSLTKGSVELGEGTSSNFLTQASMVTLGEADENGDFSLVINDSQAFASALTACGNITYTAPELTGALPTFGTKSVVGGLGTASASYDGDASFAGTTVQLGGSVNHEVANATVTQPTFTATFEGTAKTVTPTVATTASAMANEGAKITIAEHDVAVTLNKSNKTVTVQ